MTKHHRGPLARTYRAGRLTFHLLSAVATAGLVFPWLARGRRQEIVTRWSRRLLQHLNVHLDVHGTPPGCEAGKVMFVSNHVSWLDIYLINSVRASCFVAKSEVRGWPVVGWLSQKVGTIFVERGKRLDTLRVNKEVAMVLADGWSVALFPEGTTTDGTMLRSFHASLLQPAIDAEAVLWPVAVRFLKADGTVDTEPAYVDGVSFGASLARVLGRREIRARLVFGAPISPAGKTRRELGQEAHRAIAAALNLAGCGNSPEIPDDLQAAQQ